MPRVTYIAQDGKETALDVINSGHAQLVKFGISDEEGWDVGLACGGTIEVFVEPLA